MKGLVVMFLRLKFVGMFLAALLVAEPAAAQYKLRLNVPNLNVNLRPPKLVQPPIANLGVAIKPSQAAAIALGLYPGAKVVKVKLGKDGVYAVTLRTDTSVERVFISGEDGSIL